MLPAYSCIFFVILVASPIRLESKTMPKQIIDMLGNVDDFETFIDVFQMREQMTNFTAENHKMRNNDASKIAQLENEVCRPRPVLVKVTQPNHAASFRYPFYVELYRCMGSCGANPFLSRCTAAEITPMQLRVAQVGWAMESNKVSKQKKIVMLPVHNETRCTCECMNRLEGCNRFQVWEENSCRCECTGYCPSNYIYTGGHECCTCPRRRTCPRKKAWNPNKCACECRKATCKNQLKHRDPKTCKCVCNNILCRYGELDPKSCRCQRRNNIV